MVTAQPAPLHTHYNERLCVDGAGLDQSGLLHKTGFNADTWQVNYAGPITHPTGGIEGSCWIEFDLGTTYEISKMWVWNLNYAEGGTDYTGRGLKDVSIQCSTNGTTWNLLTTTTINRSTYGDGSPYPHETEIDFGGVNARYVLVTPSLTTGWWNPAQYVYGLAEVRFFKKGIASDINHNNTVNFADFGTLAGEWLKQEYWPQ
ncbi:MAG: hypothetical protein A2Y12_02380 [Planctomycetes bacterium GWF2_42_9]|nr:MAG: hypothetical protein A2Y12_02380 [Planctomycetes bacterium GWF2_42_9]